MPRSVATSKHHHWLGTFPLFTTSDTVWWSPSETGAIDEAEMMYSYRTDSEESDTEEISMGGKRFKFSKVAQE